ncbi:MAG: FtsX-like permease family protein [Gemmatimonadales bacterium]
MLGALATVDPTLSPSRLAPVSALYAESVGRRTFAMILLTAFAGAAVALGLVGLYGVLAASVTQRRQEIAVRMALGATRGAVVALVLGQALRVTAIGLVIGAVGAGLMTRLLQGLLFQVSPLDPAVFAAGAAVLAVAALVAAFVPARRAASVTPVRAFRGP